MELLESIFLPSRTFRDDPFIRIVSLSLSGYIILQIRRIFHKEFQVYPSLSTVRVDCSLLQRLRSVDDRGQAIERRNICSYAFEISSDWVPVKNKRRCANTNLLSIISIRYLPYFIIGLLLGRIAISSTNIYYLIEHLLKGKIFLRLARRKCRTSLTRCCRTRNRQFFVKISPIEVRSKYDLIISRREPNNDRVERDSDGSIGRILPNFS